MVYYLLLHICAKLLKNSEGGQRDTPREKKMTPISAFLRRFRGPDGLKYMAKTDTMQIPVVPVKMGVKNPCFSK